MDRASLTMLKALLSKHGESKAVLHFISPEEKEKIDAVVPPEQVDFPSLLSSASWMREIHYSWFVSSLADLPEESSSLLLTLFNPKESQKISDLLKVKPSSLHLSPFARIFFTHTLKEKIWPKHILPEALLPPSPMNELLMISKDALTHLIDLLGLFDLAAELKSVVDKKLLNTIHSALTPIQMQFLQYASKQPMKWIPPKLNLEGWDKEKKSLYALLHKRGLYRLGKAAMNEDESFRWHLVHRLDIGRGDYLMKLFSGKEDPAMITYFKGQVLHLLKRH